KENRGEVKMGMVRAEKEEKALSLPKSPPKRFSGGLLLTQPSCSCLTAKVSVIAVLEFKIQIGLKELVLIQRIDSDRTDPARAKTFIDAPPVRVSDVETDGIGQHVS